METMPFNADRNAIFARLEATAARANLTREERALYEEQWKNYNDYFNTLDYAVAKEKLKIACQMKQDGLPVWQITKYTGLTQEEIEEL